MNPPFAPCDTRRRLAILGIALLSGLTACSVDAPSSPSDASPDVAEAEVTSDDAPLTDAPVSSDAADDTPRADPRCDDRPWIELRATRTGEATSYVGTTALAPSSAAVAAPCGGRPTSVVGFHYTVSARSRLVVSTFHAQTDANFDTVVWAQTGCATGAPTLGCNDDVGVAYERRERPVSSRFHSFFSTSTLEAGASVYLFVGTYAPNLGTPSSATFRLTVTETDEGRAGSACDPGGARADDPRGSGCAEGTTCRPASDDLTDFRCVAPLGEGEACDPRGVRSVCSEQTFCRTMGSTSRCERRGVVGAQCRATAPRCDGTAACSVWNTCVPVVPAGAVCDHDVRTNLCAAGTSCSFFEGASRCTAPGTRGGACRGDPASCDAGLACVYSVCLPALPLGASCDPTGSRNVCSDGYCSTAPTPHCAPLGGGGAPCRRTGSPCDAGYRCNTDTCVPEVAVGGVCDGSGSRRLTSVCVEGAVCPYSRAESRCVLAGVAGAPCRPTERPCDAGLSCGSAQRCVPTLAVGTVCDPRSTENVCASGSHCVGEGGAARCLADGSNGRYCRSATPACDEDLLCDGTFCRPRVGVGGRCDPSGVEGACVPSSACVTEGGVARCVRYGSSLGVRCEISYSCPTSHTCGRCGDGLDCGADFTCVPEAAVGARCDPAHRRDGCGIGASCVASRDASRCVTDGSLNGACARGATACAPGLRCDSSNHCVPGIVQGAKCDPSGRLGACAGSTSCRYREDASYCVPDGSRGASVRAGWPQCDEGLVGLSSGICVEGIPLGSACDLYYRESACVPGASCVRGEGGDRCVADGVAGGRCSSAGRRCGAGLGCDADYFCAAGLSAGSACDPERRANVCVSGTSCGAVAGGARCVANGTDGGGCRDEEPRCDAGLACGNTAVCRPALPLGALCNVSGAATTCGGEANCLDSVGGARCFARGARGGFCHSPSSRCDEGLACGSEFRCVGAVALGEFCDPEGRRDACALGASCRPSEGGARCVADGLVGAGCRASAPRCDPGLSCAPDGASPFSPRRCVAAIPVGAACDASRPAVDRCVDGAVCVGTGRAGRCVLAGYAVAPSTEAFVDACSVPGATVLTMGPSLPSLPATLPFAFTYFGVEHAAGSTLTMGGSGWLRFGATALREVPPDELPTLYLDDAIFALWTYTTLGVDTRSPGRLCLATTGAAPSRVFVVTWSGLTRWDEPSAPDNVELQLREGTHTIDALYRLSESSATDPALGATVGLQGPGSTSTVQRCGGNVRAATPCVRALLRDTRYSP